MHAIVPLTSPTLLRQARKPRHSRKHTTHATHVSTSTAPILELHQANFSVNKHPYPYKKLGANYGIEQQLYRDLEVVADVKEMDYHFHCTA